MRYQQRGWSCGAAALVNAARSLGRKVPERTVRSLAGTTEEGTDEVGLIEATRSIGLTASPHHSSDNSTAWAFIRSNVMEGRPCMICIDQWNHWVTVVGIVGDRVLIADPANTKKNTSENGVTSVTRRDLAKRWRCRLEEEPFYAIAVGK